VADVDGWETGRELKVGVDTPCLLDAQRHAIATKDLLHVSMNMRDRFATTPA